MKPSTRRLALRAAAKVAFSASIMGCGGSVQTTPATIDPVDVPMPTIDAAVTRTSPPSLDASSVLADASDTSTALMCNAPALGSDAGVSETTFTCCIDYVVAAVEDGGIFSLQNDASIAAADTSTCCGAIFAHLANDSDASASADNDTVGAANGVIPTCCDVLGDFGKVAACTGWGPPVPPEMLGERATESELT